MAAGRQARIVAEILHVETIASGVGGVWGLGRERNWPGLLKLQILPPVTDLFQQDHAS